MKHENKNIKKLIACLICAVMIGSAIACMPGFSASATEGTTAEAPKQTYGEWRDAAPVNGSFEVGVEGEEVYGWTKTAIEYNTRKKTVDRVAGEGEDQEEVTQQAIKDAISYCKAYTLTTAIDQITGSKVAALEKKGSGHVAATSQPISVSGGQYYRMSFDYRTVATSVAEGASNGLDYYGVRFFVEELNSEGEIEKELTRYYYDTSSSDTWNTGTIELQTQANTTSVVIYLWVGGLWNRYATVYFDNVLVTPCNSDSLMNGDFEAVTLEGLGGRKADVFGPANWNVVTCGNQNGSYAQSAENHVNNYVISTEQDEVTGNCYMKMTGTDGYTYGYVWAQSNYISVNANEYCKIQYTLKSSGSTLQSYHSPRVLVFYYDSNQTFLSEVKTTYTFDQVQDWTTFSKELVIPSNAAYMTINFFIGGTRGKDQVIHYVDNVTIDSWKPETTYYYGTKPREDADFTGNYSMSTIDAGEGRESVQKLSVKSAVGAVVFFSEAIDVTPNSNYKTTYDLKIEGIADKENTNGARYLIRYIKADGSYITTTDGKFASLLNGTPNENCDWTSYTHDFVVPEEAVKLQIGLLIGMITKDTNPDMAYYFDDITLTKVQSEEMLTTDLLFVMLQGGNAVDATESEGLVDIRDLIHMKKYIAGEADVILETADMNNNRGTIGEKTVNNDDVLLLEWKLLGVTTTEQAQSVR